MSARLHDIFLAIVLGWVGWGLVSLFLPSLVALAIGVLLGAGAIRFFRDTIIPRGVMAVLDPIGVVLPLLILRQISGALGLPFLPFGAGELLIFLVIYTGFLVTAFDILPVDVYRYGYRPLPVAGIALALCLCAVLTGHWIIALIAVAGQGLWLARLGSSNYFDHILHATLVPVVLVVLIGRVLGVGG